MRWSNLFTIFRREVLDQLRDRRTLFMIFVLPILLYPMLILGVTKLAEAFQNKRSGLQVTGAGVVSRLLADDTSGDQHQRFILKLASGQTLLIAHNIDLAPRISGLKLGDRVEFYGEYEYNAEGGVVHWTHHDPAGKHPDGWLRHQEQIYQ